MWEQKLIIIDAVESVGRATMTQTVKDGEPCANKTERLQQRLDQRKRERKNRGEKNTEWWRQNGKKERKKETTQYNPSPNPSHPLSLMGMGRDGIIV